MASIVVNGTNINIYINGQKIAQAQSGTLSIEVDTPEATNKDSGGWAEFIHGKRSWTLEADGVAIVNTGQVPSGQQNFYQFLQAVVNRTTVTVEFRPVSTVAGDLIISGEAIINSLSEEAPTEDVTTFSVSFQGTGPLTVTVV